MNRRLKIGLAVFASLVILVLVTGCAALFVAQSDWLREKLRAAIVEQAETATGGRVEIAKFQLNWSSLNAEVDGLVIHGTEAPSQAPFLAVDHVTIGLRIVSLFTRDIRLEKLTVTRPRAHIIIDAAGGTNLPRPKTTSNARTADTILNLKIAHVAVRDGTALAESPGNPPHTYPWSGGGRNLALLATYDPARDRYAGDVSFAPLHLTLEGYGPLDVDLTATAAMERNRVFVQKATLKSQGSEIDLSEINIGSFADPVVTAHYGVTVSAAEAARVLHWKLPISGTVNVAGNARYVSPEDFELAGDLRGTGLAYGKVRNIRLTGKVAGSQAKMAITSLRASLLGGTAVGGVETKGYEVYRIAGTIAGLDARNLAALGTTQTVPYDGVLAGTVAATGRFRDTSRFDDATAHLTIGPAAIGPTAHGELSVHYTGSTSKLEVSNSWLQLPNTRLDVSGTLGAAQTISRASSRSTSLAVKLDTNDLNDLLPVMSGQALPFTLRNGSASFAGTVSGTLDDPRVEGHVTLNHAVYDNRLVDSVTGDVTASATQATTTHATLVYDGITASVAGTITLTNWSADKKSAVSGDVTIGNVDLVHALTLSGLEKDVPATGTVSVSAKVSGTVGQPAGSADVTFSKGLFYQQPYDSITSHLQYTNADLQTASGVFTSGPKRVTFDIRYPHNGQTFPAGSLEISAASNTMALNQIALLRQRQPDIQGTAQFQGKSTVRVSVDAQKTAHFELTSLNGDGTATGIGLAGRELGNSHFSARTQAGTLTADFDSNVANAAIKGQARVELTGDDRTTGSISLSNANVGAVAALLSSGDDAKKFAFDGSVEAQVDFSGPLFLPAQMTATATVRQLEVHPTAGSPLAKAIAGFSLRSSGQVKVSYEKSVIRVDSAHFLAPETDMTISGTADTLSATPLNLRLQGDVNLAILRNFVPDLVASGTVSVAGLVRGSWGTPDFSGRAGIRNGEFHYPDFANGLSNATGSVVFSGSRATIESFNAETGGGKLTGAGFANLIPDTGEVAFQFSARTKDVRLRYPQGVSSISDSELQLVRNPQRSSISGTVTVRRLVFNPQQDAAWMLADMSQSARTPAAGSNSLANMNLDILIQTAPDVALQSKVAESIQADASLRLRGTVASPALLGRVNVSQGEVLFFGNKYTISRGAISFFNPSKIDPILDVDLQTKARGVDVTLTVTGSPSNLGMTYRSDPPLEFSDIVALLATGRTPDDPSVALRGNAPTPSFEQLGASALIGQTLANPVAGRLQRFFGVSRIKIDPQLSGVGGNPGARLTVEQQVTPDILFTYITDVSNTSQQLIRVEWAFNRNWSAVLEREQNGYVGLDFTYKKRFK